MIAYKEYCLQVQFLELIMASSQVCPAVCLTWVVLPLAVPDPEPGPPSRRSTNLWLLTSLWLFRRPSVRPILDVETSVLDQSGYVINISS